METSLLFNHEETKISKSILWNGEMVFCPEEATKEFETSGAIKFVKDFMAQYEERLNPALLAKDLIAKKKEPKFVFYCGLAIGECCSGYSHHIIACLENFPEDSISRFLEVNHDHVVEEEHDFELADILTIITLGVVIYNMSNDPMRELRKLLGGL